MVTQKGAGYAPAEAAPERYHWRAPFDLTSGEDRQAAPQESYSAAIIDELLQQVEAGVPIAAITAGIPGAFDLHRFEKQYPTHYFDVGIAEQMSVTSAVAMAQAGIRPVVFESSTFLQRAYDQLVHDMALNSVPVVMIVRGGTISAGSATHQGSFDISYLSSLPNIEYLAPTSVEEMLSMLRVGHCANRSSRCHPPTGKSGLTPSGRRKLITATLITRSLTRAAKSPSWPWGISGRWVRKLWRS